MVKNRVAITVAGFVRKAVAGLIQNADVVIANELQRQRRMAIPIPIIHIPPDPVDFI